MTAGPEGAAAAALPPRAPGVVADYVTLLKPRIMVLLLVTTSGAMAWAAEGLPPLGLTVATLARAWAWPPAAPARSTTCSTATSTR